MTDITVNINYRIIEIDKQNHSFVVRYWSDFMSEDSLATSVDENGNILRGSDEKPLRCQTDVSFSLYENTNPTVKDIEEIIFNGANAIWFYTKQQLLSGNNVYNMENLDSIFQKNETLTKDVFSKQLDTDSITLDFIKNSVMKQYPNSDIVLTIKKPSNTEIAKATVEYI